MDVVAATNIVAPLVLGPLVDYIAELTPQQAIGALRDLLTRLPQIGASEWESAIEEGAVRQLLGLGSQPSF